MKSLSFTLRENLKLISIATGVFSIFFISVYYFFVPQYEIYEVQTENPQIVQFFHQFKHFEDFKMQRSDKMTWAIDLKGKMTLVFYFIGAKNHQSQIKVLLQEMQQNLNIEQDIIAFTEPYWVGVFPNLYTIIILLILISFFMSNIIVLFYKTKIKEK